MFEIEMKAHVLDRKNVIEKLESFAEYKCSIEKKDTYYRIPLSENPSLYKSARIRYEKKSFPFATTDSKKEQEEIIFTYKREKNLCQNGDKNSIEVNTELECSVSDGEPLLRFFLDIGGKIGNIKQKIVECYHYETECGLANIELCTVPPLGDFLEIEIVSEKNDDEFISKAKKIEEEIFLKCGISLDQLESRYYNDMLNDFKEKSDSNK